MRRGAAGPASQGRARVPSGAAVTRLGPIGKARAAATWLPAMVHVRFAALLSVVAALASPAFAAPPEAIVNAFREGNARYQSGDFSGAAESYEAALSHGFESATLHYNLGNAELKRGELGRAIFEYRCSLRLDPNHPDARANLEYARSLAVDVPPPAADPWLLRVFIAIERAVPLPLALRAAAVSYWVLAALVAVSWLVPSRRRESRASAAACAAVLAVSLVLALLGATRERQGSEGVILDQEVAVRTGPDETSTVLFSLHEGAEVEIQRRTERWVEVRISDELRGWVEAGAIGVL